MIHPEPYEHTTPTARTEHECCECGCTIQPGDTYEHVRGCWDGSWSTFKTCIPCADLRDRLADGGEYHHGRLGERVHEEFTPINQARDTDVLAFCAREMMADAGRYTSEAASGETSERLLINRHLWLARRLERASTLLLAAADLREAGGEGCQCG